MGPIEQYIATNNDVFSACCRCPPHTERPQQWRCFREVNASNEEYCRPSSVFDLFMMRRCYGICFRWPQGNIRWVYTLLINLEIAYDNLEFQVVVRFQVVVQQQYACMIDNDHMKWYCSDCTSNPRARSKTTNDDLMTMIETIRDSLSGLKSQIEKQADK